MNEADLQSLWPHRHRFIDAGDSIVSELPSAWRSIVAEHEEERIAAFKAFARPVFHRMPQTFAYLDREVRDAYLVEAVGVGPALIVDFLDEDVRVSYFGFAPKARKTFAGDVGAFYSKLDGFSDLMSMGGLMPFAEITPIGSEGFAYETSPSAETFGEMKTTPYVRIFDSGGKGYGYLDASTTHSEEPTALVLWVDDTPPLTDQPFWDLMDSWTLIALGGG